MGTDNTELTAEQVACPVCKGHVARPISQQASLDNGWYLQTFHCQTCDYDFYIRFSDSVRLAKRFTAVLDSSGIKTHHQCPECGALLVYTTTITEDNHHTGCATTYRLYECENRAHATLKVLVEDEAKC